MTRTEEQKSRLSPVLFRSCSQWSQCTGHTSQRESSSVDTAQQLEAFVLRIQR